MKIAVIPARGGSKRIPMKNIKNFSGKPIIAWSIEVAIKSKLFDRVIVSTDNHEIASIAKQHGADVPFMRSKHLSDDYTGTNAVVKDVIQNIHKNGEQVSYVCCIYATAPFVSSKYLIKAYQDLINQNKSYAFSVTTYSFPVKRSFVINQSNVIENLFPDMTLSRSQDLQEVYHDAGQFYWGLADAFLNDLPIFSRHSIPIILPRYLVQDIDTIEDWKQAELMFESYLNNKDLYP
jgi:N-acylneuraminate cytidylyltransferase